MDEIGIDTFSMRLLAERLGTGTATLYRHLSGKDELMAHVVDRLFLEIGDAGGTGPARGTGWQNAIRIRCDSFRRVLGRHPNLLPLLAAQVPVGPNALAVREQAISSLVSFGFPVPLAARTFTTLGHYVIGFALQEPSTDWPGGADALATYYRSLDPATHAFTVAAADALTTVAPEDEFAEGLQFILDGIDCARRRASRTS